MIQNKITILIIIGLISPSACYKKETRKLEDNRHYEKEILYELKPQTTDYIADSIINDKDILFCEFSYNEGNASTYISFVYEELSQQSIEIANSSTRFLIIKDKKIPVIFFTDVLYSTVKDDSVRYLHSSKSKNVAIDAQGNLY